ncbi:MAG TPA: TetR/AcrR family transcriptional regulator [Solirubrobacterales bacterium]|jgi:AcrR family transcriptional regulator
MATRGGGEESGVDLPRLPPGRHGLSRDFVVENQRQRIAAGMIQVVVEAGYTAATVTEVVAAAKVSRRTFYNYYGDKREAFLDVYGQVADFICGAMEEAGEAERGGWAARVRAELAALLGCFGANQDLVRFSLVAPPAAGGDVAGAYRDFLERILRILRDGRPKSSRQPPPASEYGLVGGLAALIVAALDNHSGSLDALLPEVTELVLTPYLGRDAAARAAH